MERYHNDPTFHAITDMLRNLYEQHCGSGAGITPSEIREASGLAWQMYAERNLVPSILIRRETP